MAPERILLMTGKLAEPALRRVMQPLAASLGFDFEIRVLKISVAALMHTEWLRRQIHDVSGYDRVLLSGWCQGDRLHWSARRLGYDPVALFVAARWGWCGLRGLDAQVGQRAVQP